MHFRTSVSSLLGVIALGVWLSATAFSQDQQQYPPQYPPTQYPQPQQSYPPQEQYPPPGQYPPAQGQYPPPQGQYPSQGQYPQGQYPPPQQAPYPPAEYPSAQYPPQYNQPPMLGPQQLQQLAQPIALYPDGLLAQVLTASTFWQEIPAAAGWANAHAYLKGEALAQAIQQDNLAWDPSILALLPFPNVLNYMAQYMGWTQALGNAVLTQRGQLMDAVQYLRQEAYNYGYLQNNSYQRVIVAPGAIEIVPINPGFYYVPYYNPAVVFVRPRPGFVIGAAIRFGPGITIGAAFAPWGWGAVGFGWTSHTILIDNHPWTRTWVNRGSYVHTYAQPYHHEGPPVEHHDVHGDHGHDDHHDHH